MRVMNHDRYPVGGKVNVELDRVCSRGDCLRERLDCVFRSVRAIPAMTDDRPGM